ncbi:Two component system response regulator/histidine kinase, PAS and HAMP domains-containing [Desulfonema limicola]|uniref:histidine kinase n=1 Tax=Desulfonema limicola TaxID=45656 RepID=A0A975BBX3_9BACT|nr:PAS domain S-box protein [Desulfonema limicola]QTA82582.1 Two component system response regulator/histidine kinase, PAS and HAMP domains-containing [Desulfonema limicola]
MEYILKIFNSLIFRLTACVGLVLLISISVWAYFNLKYHKENTFNKTIAEADHLADTIKLGTHYAMMLNSKEDINEIITNIARQDRIKQIRIYNKQGEIKFSNIKQEINEKTNIKASACDICHKTEHPVEELDILKRIRVLTSPEEANLLGIISPINNEPSCSTGPCHFHPEDKKILGALDLVISMKDADKEILSHERQIINMAIFSFFSISGIISLFFLIYVIRPINRLIVWTERIGKGEYDLRPRLDKDGNDEIGQLADAIHYMGKRIQEKQYKLNRQKDEYQQLFEQVPCYITVLDKDMKLLKYNKAFTEHFNPRPGEYCYSVYKGRTEKCDMCPVARTFEDGKSHYSEETGISKDGSRSHWCAQASPIKNAQGEVVAVVEMCLDITLRKHLEERIRKTEEQYRVIFDNIPNPVFVLDSETLEILDYNESQRAVFGYDKHELLGKSFMDMFEQSDRESYANEIKTSNIINKIRYRTRDGHIRFINLRVSPSEYMEKKTLLVTASDITEKLIAEQQVIHAGKMTTLGEMATGIAHELNQPLTVIKTASSFLIRKLKRSEKIKDEILQTMTEEIDAHVIRASKIINHLREFGRKSSVIKEEVNVNEAIEKAIEMFVQQLRLREIRLHKNFDPDLPLVLADSNRLEQIFVNLLINARDAIEEKWEDKFVPDGSKEIDIRTEFINNEVKIIIADNGTGIPQNIKDRIFEPFFTTKKVGRGTGLGLSISYGIVQDYDGIINIETVENKGTKFIIRFPAVKDYS